MSGYGFQAMTPAVQERYSPNGPNVTFARRAAQSELPGTAVYGVQEIPVKKPMKTQFEKTKAELNVKQSKVRPSINTTMRKTAESKRVNPIAMNPIVPSGAKKDTPTFRSSPENPLSRQQGSATPSGNALRSSSRYAARLKFEAAHSKPSVSDGNKYASQWEACRDVKETKTKEKTVLKDHPHGGTQGIIYRARPEGMTLPGLGFGSSSCQS